jgi:hypothetical protein
MVVNEDIMLSQQHDHRVSKRIEWRNRRYLAIRLGNERGMSQALKEWTLEGDEKRMVYTRIAYRKNKSQR